MSRGYTVLSKRTLTSILSKLWSAICCNSPLLTYMYVNGHSPLLITCMLMEESVNKCQTTIWLKWISLIENPVVFDWNLVCGIESCFHPDNSYSIKPRFWTQCGAGALVKLGIGAAPHYVRVETWSDSTHQILIENYWIFNNRHLV